MNIKKLSALLVLMSVFVFSAAIPAFAKTSSPIHPPQCKTSEINDKVIIECLDAGEDIVKADIIKYNQLPNYTVEWDGNEAVITVFLNDTSPKMVFAWAVVDKQGSMVVGYFPTINDEG